MVLSTPLLALVPVAAIAVAILAVRNIAVSGGQLVGRPMAVAGLCLATLFLGWSFARHFSRQQALRRNARCTVDSWLALVQAGRLKEALQMRQPSSERITTLEALNEHYEKDAEAAQGLQTFASSRTVKELIAQGQQAGLRFEGVASSSSAGFIDALILRYSYVKPASSERQPIWIHVNRTTSERTKQADWDVGGMDTNAPATAQ